MTESGNNAESTATVAILGAGLAGLAAARTLAELGREAVVFDKGRGPGGRTSSRRAEPFVFDHGAQYFTARDPEFRKLVDQWIAAGVVATWPGRIVALEGGETRSSKNETERHVGLPRMSALARHLATDVTLQVGTRVMELDRTANGWNLRGENNAPLGEYSQLLVTAPPAQAAALIGQLSPLGAKAAEIPMQPCWAVMLGLAATYPVSFDGAFCANSALSWVARNSNKPGRPESECWVLHASPEWTRAHLDESPDVVARLLIRELEQQAGASLPRIVHSEAHLWRYSQPDGEMREGFLFDRERGLALAGDAYCGGRVEGAYLSGLAAARALAQA